MGEQLDLRSLFQLKGFCDIQGLDSSVLTFQCVGAIHRADDLLTDHLHSLAMIYTFQVGSETGSFVSSQILSESNSFLFN